MTSHLFHRIRAAFAIGEAGFNLALVAVLMTITFVAVALPDRSTAEGLAMTDGEGPPATVPSALRVVPTSPSTTTTPTPTSTVAPTTNTTAETPDVDRSTAADRPTNVGRTERVVYRPQPTPAAAPPAPPTCADFATQPEAQTSFDVDPVGLAHFDGDGDGRACEDLPGTPPELPPVVEPPPTLSVAAVRAQRGVYGMHTRESPGWMGELDYITRLTGKAPNNLLFFSNWAMPFPADGVEASWNRGMTPQVAWEPVVPGADSQPKLQAIVDGEWDAYIDEWAAAAAAHGQPIVLRLAAEMNGSWYPWSETGFGNAPGQYADMWRHVHDRFEAAGADNVVWLWSVNRVDNQHTDIATYWPGPEYVDWVGISGYWRNQESAPEPTFDAVFGRTLTELRAITDKPILLAEIGAGTNVDADRVEWLNTVFDGLRANPDLIGFVYFNDQKAGGDWRIQFSQGMVDAFANGIADARWTSGVLPPGMEPGERLAVPAFGDPDIDLGNPDGTNAPADDPEPADPPEPAVDVEPPPDPEPEPAEPADHPAIEPPAIDPLMLADGTWGTLRFGDPTSRTLDADTSTLETFFTVAAVSADPPSPDQPPPVADHGADVDGTRAICGDGYASATLVVLDVRVDDTTIGELHGLVSDDGADLCGVFLADTADAGSAPPDDTSGADDTDATATRVRVEPQGSTFA